MPFVLYSQFHIDLDTYNHRSSARWPMPEAGTILPAAEGLTPTGARSGDDGIPAAPQAEAPKASEPTPPLEPSTPPPPDTPATMRGHYIREFSEGGGRVKASWNTIALVAPASPASVAHSSRKPTWNEAMSGSSGRFTCTMKRW